MIIIIALGVALGIVIAPVLLPVAGILAGVALVVVVIRLITRFVAAVVRAVAAGPMWLMAILADKSRPLSNRVGIAILSTFCVAFGGLMILGIAMPPKKYPDRVTTRDETKPMEVGETRTTASGIKYTRTK